MSAPENLVTLVRAESERLEQYLATLPPDAWARPSACDGWEVRDVVAHLVMWAELYVHFISRAVQGDLSPLEGWPPTGSRTGAAFHAWSAQAAIAHRERLGVQLLPTFRATHAQFNQVVMGLGPQDWEKPSYHPIGIRPVRERVETMLVEKVIHGWDIRSRLEPAAPLLAASLPIVSDWAARRGVNALGLVDFRPTASRLMPVCYHFAVTNIPPRGYDIVVEQEHIRMEPAVTASPTVTFRCDAETFVLTVLGRLKLATVIADGRVAVEGDHGLAQELIGWLTRA